MKLGLVGPKSAGKTAYLSGLCARFENQIAMRPLRATEFVALQNAGATEQMMFGLTLLAPNQLISAFKSNKALILANPITDWPDPTKSLNALELQLRLQFRSIGHEPGVTTAVREHKKSLKFIDPAGEALDGSLPAEHEPTIEALEDCDVLMFLLDGALLEHLLGPEPASPKREEAIRSTLQEALQFDLIRKLSHRMRARMRDSDVLPVSVVITKSDQISEAALRRIDEYLYDDVLLPFSEQNPNLLMCVCPISVYDPDYKAFSPQLLEWPFVFCVGGALMRQALAHKRAAASAASTASYKRSEANRLEALASGDPLKRLWVLLFEEPFVTADDKRGSARHYEGEAEKEGRMSASERSLGVEVWRQLATAGGALGVKLWQNGRRVETPWDVM